MVTHVPSGSIGGRTTAAAAGPSYANDGPIVLVPALASAAGALAWWVAMWAEATSRGRMWAAPPWTCLPQTQQSCAAVHVNAHPCAAARAHGHSSARLLPAVLQWQGPSWSRS